MARKKGENAGEQLNPLGWMVTFSDLVTLLLTFFVLLISMSSMDVKTIRQAFGLFFTGGSGPLEFTREGQLEDLGKILERLEQLPSKALMEQQKLKEMIFKFDDTAYARLLELLKDEVEVEATEGGLAIRMSNYILFNKGSAELKKENLPLLHRLAEALRVTQYPISVEGHTDASLKEGGTEAAAWELSLERALAVMKYFTVEEGMRPDRFRVGGLGPSQPLVPNDSAQNRARNRRIEVVLYKERLG